MLANETIRVLYIDDDAEDYQMIRDMFVAMPQGRYTLEWVADYDDALGMMQKLEHDVYIVDYVLGEKNGLSLIENSFPKGCQVPVILLTARGRRDVDQQAMALGVTEYIDKADIRLPILERTLRYAIHNKRIESELRASEALFRSLVESAVDYIHLLDSSGIILRTNQAAISKSGYAQDELVGQPFTRFLPDASSLKIDEMLKTLVAQGSIRNEIEFVHRDSSRRTMECSWSTVDDAGRQRILVIQRDVTERKLNELKLMESLEREKELNALKSRFVSMASHELRNPLTTIQTNIYMLKNYQSKMDASAITQKLDKVEAMVHHMEALLNDVLSISRIQTGKVQFNPTLMQFDLYPQDLVEEFRGNAGKSHTLEFQNTADKLEMPLDYHLMRQIISNLLDNAIKYSPAGSTITVKLERKDKDVVTTITDHGIGIPDEAQTTVFDPFERAGNVGSISGSGLGLSIVKQAVEMHGGSITFNSKVGEGTTFVLTLHQS